MVSTLGLWVAGGLSIALLLAGFLLFQKPRPNEPAGALQQRMGAGHLPPPLFRLAVLIWGLVFACLLLGLLVTVWSLVVSLMPGQTRDPEAGRLALLTLAGLTAAGGVVVALPFAILRLHLVQRQTVATEDGLLTDRITAAVEGLGSVKTVARPTTDETDPRPVEHSEPNIEVRIGAILTLERLAQRHPGGHILIMDILTAYIRHNAKARHAPPLPDCPRDSPAMAEGDPNAFDTWKKALSAALSGTRPRDDVQMALTVIGRRSATQKAQESRAPAGPYTLDLRGTDLRGAEFGKGDFRQARMSAAHLQGAHLVVADLARADLTGAHLQGASLVEARLQGATLWEAHLSGADLWGAQLQGASLGHAHLEGASLGEAQLQGAFLGQARMTQANLWSAHLDGANLQQAHLDGATLEATSLCGTNLVDASLKGAELADTCLDAKTNLFGASLRGAALSGIDFTDLPQIRAHVAQCFGDASVTLPGGVRPGHPDWPAHWSPETLSDRERDGKRVDLFREAWAAFRATLPPEH